MFFFQYRAVLIDGQSISDSYDFDIKYAHFLCYTGKNCIYYYIAVLYLHTYSTLSSFSQFSNPQIFSQSDYIYH